MLSHKLASAGVRETGSKTDLDFMAFEFGDFGVTLNRENYYKRLKFLFWVFDMELKL